MRIQLDNEKMKMCQSLTCKGNHFVRPWLQGIHVTHFGYSATNGKAMIYCCGGPDLKEGEGLIVLAPLKIAKTHKELWYDTETGDLEYHGKMIIKYHVPQHDWKYPSLDRAFKSALDLGLSGSSKTVALDPKLLALFPEGAMVSATESQEGNDEPMMIVTGGGQGKWVGILMPMQSDRAIMPDVWDTLNTCYTAAVCHADKEPRDEQKEP